MALIKLFRLAINSSPKYTVLKSTQVFTPSSIRNFTNSPRPSASSNEEIVSSKPVQYTGSKAEAWRAQYTRSGDSSEVPWIQQYAVLGSVVIFMVYFCILREENDIDENLYQSLYISLDKFEEDKFELKIADLKKKGISTGYYEEQLKNFRESRK